MDIIYKDDKNFTLEEIHGIFQSVGWVSAKYPNRLYQALMNSATVITAWDGDKLIGLIRAMDDGALTAYLHYALVHPKYQGAGVAYRLMEMIKEKYRDYLYINLMPEEDKNISFYEKMGFQVMTEGAAMQRCNPNIAD